MSDAETPAKSLSVAGILFDFDGVLVDSVREYYNIWLAVYRQHGLWISSDQWESLRRTSSDKTHGAFKRSVANNLQSRLLTSIDKSCVIAEVKARYTDMLDRVEPRTGIREWVQEASEAHLRLAVVTDESTQLVRRFLTRTGLTEYFEVIVGHSAGLPKKPHPAPYREAIARLALRPNQLIAIEDSLPGIASARTANISVIAVAHTLNNHILIPKTNVVIAHPAHMSLRGALRLVGGELRLPVSQRSQRPERAQASFEGLALGDSLGKLLARRSDELELDEESKHVLRAYQENLAPPSLFRGRVTDDTIQTAAVAKRVATDGSLRRDFVEFDLRRINPNGGRALFRLRESSELVNVATAGDSNGCIPRAAVLGWRWGADNPGDLIFDTIKLASVTHGSPEAQAVAVSFALLVGAGIDGFDIQDALSYVRSHSIAIHQAARYPVKDSAVMTWLDRAAELVIPGANMDFAMIQREFGLTERAASSGLTAMTLALCETAPLAVLDELCVPRSHMDLDSIMAMYLCLIGSFGRLPSRPAWVERVSSFSHVDFAQARLIATAVGTGVNRRRAAYQDKLDGL